MIFFCFFFVLLFSPSSATYGVDVSELTSESSFKCLKGNGYDFAIVRCWRSLGSADPNCPDSVKNAWAAGLAHVDVYMFPCPKCGDAEGQVAKAVAFLKEHSVKYGMFWLDIEGSEYWLGSTDKNRVFFEQLLTGCRSAGVKVGIYASKYMWETLMGSDYSGGRNYPLWYPHYDANPSFSDFSAFGGWSKPAIKQYSDQSGACSAGYDRNWYP